MTALLSTLPTEFETRIDEARVSADMAAERYRQFMVRQRLTAASGALPSAYLAWLLWPALDHQRLISWWCALLLVDMASVLFASRALTRLRLQTSPSGYRLWRQIALQSASGLLWSQPIVWSLGHPDALRDAGLVVLAVNSIGMIGLLNYRSAIIAWELSVWSWPLLSMFARPEWHNQQLAMGVLLLLLSMNFYLWEASGQLVEGLEERFRAKALADALHEAAHRIHAMATHDELTGCANRRQGMQQLQQLIQPDRRKAEAQSGTSVLLMDIDHFKRVNDSLGHPGGDAVLREVSRRLQAQLRQGDLLARVGGEEFMVLLPQCGPADATALAERLRLAVASNPINAGDQALMVTISMGVHHLAATDTVESALSVVDRALYSAKHQGRNQVVGTTSLASSNAATA